LLLGVDLHRAVRRRATPRVALLGIAGVDESAAIENQVDAAPRQLDRVLVVVGMAAAPTLPVRSARQAQVTVAASQGRDAGIRKQVTRHPAMGGERLEPLDARGAE